MKILLLEYITAGGLCDETLPPSLLKEGVLMRQALMNDFSEVVGVEIVTTVDFRLAKMNDVNVISADMNPVSVWKTLLQQCDAYLVVAPEMDSILSDMTDIFGHFAAKNLGSDLTSIRLTASKFATYKALLRANVLTIPSWQASTFTETVLMNLSHFKDGFIVKRDDGAGCDGIYFFATLSALTLWLSEHIHDLHRYIVQPFQRGQAASLSILCYQGEAWLLSCNLQKIEHVEHNGANTLRYMGSVVNGCVNFANEFVALGKQIAEAIPGLQGYVGVDVIVSDGKASVVEINPRITTSYIGLRESIGINPAALILDCDQPCFIFPKLQAKAVEVDVDA